MSGLLQYAVNAVILKIYFRNINCGFMPMVQEAAVRILTTRAAVCHDCSCNHASPFVFRTHPSAMISVNYFTWYLNRWMWPQKRIHRTNFLPLSDQTDTAMGIWSSSGIISGRYLSYFELLYTMRWRGIQTTNGMAQYVQVTTGYHCYQLAVNRRKPSVLIMQYMCMSIIRIFYLPQTALVRWRRSARA